MKKEKIRDVGCCIFLNPPMSSFSYLLLVLEKKTMQQHLLLLNSRGGTLPLKRSALYSDKVEYNVFPITSQTEKAKKKSCKCIMYYYVLLCIITYYYVLLCIICKCGENITVKALIWKMRVFWYRVKTHPNFTGIVYILQNNCRKTVRTIRRRKGNCSTQLTVSTQDKR